VCVLVGFSKKVNSPGNNDTRRQHSIWCKTFFLFLFLVFKQQKFEYDISTFFWWHGKTHELSILVLTCDRRFTNHGGLSQFE
jgi:hypothetical protein